MTFINASWEKALEPYTSDNFGLKKDKRIEGWKDILSRLPIINNRYVNLKSGVEVSIDLSLSEKLEVRELLLNLMPWRKGPFLINDLLIDSEWKSDLKWGRFLDLQVELAGKSVLDVGSGNGYSGFRMLGEGAKKVLCLEPNLIHVSQFAAINHFVNSKNIKMLPERLESVDINEPSFDVIFSMGLLYHQRQPLDHLQLLNNLLNDNGLIVLETIVLPEEFGEALLPSGRYANMPNVHYVHTQSGLTKLIGQADLEVVHSSKPVLTTLNEQRPTEWMPFSSLDSALKVDNLEFTIEDFPAPTRQFLVLRNLNNQL
jgi:tRNA (mo5U34)-methyltransferase